MRKKKQPIDKLAKLATKFRKPSPTYSLVEKTSRHGTVYGYCFRDSRPVMISTDKDQALDFIYGLIRREHHVYDDVIQTASPHVDELAEEEVLTEPAVDAEVEA